MTPREIWTEIHVLEEELLRFEAKYGVRSETFYAAYASGEEPGEDSWTLDFAEWASVYRTWLARQAEYRNELARAQPTPPSLQGCGKPDHGSLRAGSGAEASRTAPDAV